MTTTICADASIVANVLSNSHPESSFQQLWTQWRTDETLIVAPTLLLYEICNSLHRAVVAGRITVPESKRLLEVALSLDVQLYRDAELHQQALKIAQRENLPASYDAHYLALAERLGIEFWTGDRRLFNTVRSRLSWVHLVG